MQRLTIAIIIACLTFIFYNKPSFFYSNLFIHQAAGLKLFLLQIISCCHQFILVSYLFTLSNTKFITHAAVPKTIIPTNPNGIPHMIPKACLSLLVILCTKYINSFSANLIWDAFNRFIEYGHLRQQRLNRMKN